MSRAGHEGLWASWKLCAELSRACRCRSGHLETMSNQGCEGKFQMRAHKRFKEDVYHVLVELGEAVPNPVENRVREKS